MGLFIPPNLGLPKTPVKRRSRFPVFGVRADPGLHPDRAGIVRLRAVADLRVSEGWGMVQAGKDRTATAASIAGGFVLVSVAALAVGTRLLIPVG